MWDQGTKVTAAVVARDAGTRIPDAGPKGTVTARTTVRMMTR